VASSFPRQFWRTLLGWWREQSRERSRKKTHDESVAPTITSATLLLIRNLWNFVCDSTPERRRQRYGDMDYDWENRVDTTCGTVGWRARLLGLFHSPYQPTDPGLFREMMASLPIEFDTFTFIDLGSGKGRALLMASEYPFRKIMGVELLEELHRAAEENIRTYRSATQRCKQIESVCADACEFLFPDIPLVLYLFNPLPEGGLRRLVANLEYSLERSPRLVWIVYHNPAMDSLLAASLALLRAGGTEQYSLFTAAQRQS
jgi:hypothetical protein